MFNAIVTIFGILICFVESSKPFRTGRRPKKFSKGPLTKEASTHTFHKIRAPARCSECDSYVFSGVECAQCGLSCHSKKCLENLQTPCSHSVSTSTQVNSAIGLTTQWANNRP